jgi:Flp pilus assembly protein TadD
MTTGGRVLKTEEPQPGLKGAPEAARNPAFRLTRRQLSLALMGLALAYAFLSGFHTLYDLDMGWQLATGRYVVQHHAVPTTDVLSYTSPGAEWIYPPLAGVLFYGIYSAFGYGGMTWFCALALAALVAWLVQASFSRTESIAAAVLAIFAVPTLATRMGPRPDLFTQLFFAIFLIELWIFHYRSAFVSEPEHDGEKTVRLGTPKRLWILPLVMLLWVNLHPGFVAGLGILFVYLLMEALEFVFPSRRAMTQLRLRQAWPLLAATVVVTLLNPFGYKIYKSALTLAGLRPSQPGKGPDIWELQPMLTTPASLTQAMDWRSPGSSYWWLAAIAVVVIGGALWRRRVGAALLMAGALYASLQHMRYQGMFAIVVVVLGSAILTEEFQRRCHGNAKTSVKPSGLVRWLAVIAGCALCLLVGVRMTDLVSSRVHVIAGSATLFGSGESWWFPERAAAFIQRERLPGNVFQDYNLGGFASWRLGPAYGDFIDGRNVDPAIFEEKQGFISSPPDSPLWQAESDRRSINTLFFSLGPFSGGGTPDLMLLCRSHLWRPVYLDEVSMVLLRVRPENRPWIDRFEVNCGTHQFLPPTNPSRRELSTFYYHSGITLLSLGRIDEALEALTRGEAISPDDPLIHATLASIYDQQKRGGAEQEYATALSLKKDSAENWFSLGRFYFFQGRFEEARHLVVTAAQLTWSPVNEYILLGFIDLMLHRPESALLDFSKSEEVISRWQGRANISPEIFAQIAEGRAQAYLALGRRQRAIESQQEAVRRMPEDASRWQALARIYDEAGLSELAEQAHQKAQALSRR